ncbi:MAG: nicotinate (nicotinamide) nucleotide adenylyltransferase [Elusimicrobia bacterium]|nr:nicotinate (nicotinamide) nucleotide adenylyltransferase [Elusimicrobiota bacterium]
MERRIGIFGGSFDPLHRGHLALAAGALRELDLDQIYFVPARSSPLKPHGPVLAASQRLKEIRSALKPFPRFKVSDCEIERQGPSYSFQTVLSFRRKFPSSALFLLMGSDTLKDFKKWKNWREILSQCQLGVARRAGNEENLRNLRKELKGKIHWLKSRIPSVSSTEIRLEPYLRKHLTRERFAHTLGVAKFAEKLARAHRLDVRRAKLAALLHDLAREWDEKELLRYVQKHSLKVPEKKFTCERQPILLHSFVGADLARNIFFVQDRKVLSAVEKHSLGSLKMSPLDKCLYLADLLAPDRKFEDAAQLRRLALQNLDRAFVEGVRSKRNYALKKHALAHPLSVRVWNRFVSDKTP